MKNITNPKLFTDVLLKKLFCGLFKADHFKCLETCLEGMFNDNKKYTGISL